ncbi:MAG: NAD(P)H-hydrate dehydratase [Clostridiales bacterium]|nr:NAD(P)H-hydrate dehydratase [Clostridiales bacterium]
MKLFTAAQSRELDRKTIEEQAVPSLQLMETAAAALADAAESMAVNNSAAIFCGSGNNGGDGIAAARILASRGFSVRAFLIGNRAKLTEDAAAMERRLIACGHSLEDYNGCLEQLEFIKASGVLVDAMLGTGLNNPVHGKYAEVIELINSLSIPTVAADIPSGISADTGAVLGCAVKADRTITFGYPKIGQFIEPGCVKAGRLTTADIGILPDTEILDACQTFSFTDVELKNAVPKRDPLTHKGSYGKLIILGGSVGYTGAPYLAAQAAVRSGAGLVFLGVPEDIYQIEAVKCSEAMPFPLKCVGGMTDGNESSVIAAVNEKLKSCTVCLAGPGMGRGTQTTALIAHILGSSRIPVILDADGINALSENIDILDRAACPVILTPHEAEFARIGGHINGDRLEAARGFAMKHNCYLVLKGHRSITAFPDGRCYINTSGNAGMAKGGSGDVLSGIVAALCGQLPLETAIPAAVYIHGYAGDLAAKKYGEYSMTPSDIISMLPEAFPGS